MYHYPYLPSPHRGKRSNVLPIIGVLVGLALLTCIVVGGAVVAFSLLDAIVTGQIG